MFSRYFHLTENPFGEAPDARYFFLSEPHMSALNHLLATIQSGKGLCAINGEVGTGKTLLSRVALRLLDHQGAATAVIAQPIFQGADFLVQIAREFGLQPDGGAQANVRVELDRLTEFFLRNAEQKRRSVLFIDEAHKLSFEALESVRLLTNLETAREKIVQVVLFSQPELERKLQAHHMRQVKQRLALRTDLRPLRTLETQAYLRHRVDIAGGSNFVRFEPRAADLIHQVSGGVPRLINFYAELALLLAESRQQRLVDRAIVRSALKDVRGEDGLSLKRLLNFGW
ncbi:MAG: AAA family ATPase [Bdellovibrionaceae bacterium]|nr:AAA family ATPase [Pseudobdellovibrionaceae bacterium]